MEFKHIQARVPDGYGLGGGCGGEAATRVFSECRDSEAVQIQRQIGPAPRKQVRALP